MPVKTNTVQSKQNATRGKKASQTKNAVMLRPTHVLSAARFPSNQTYMFRYATSVSLNPGAAGSNALYQFRANDLYDPDFTSTGGQPRGFDQIMAFYNHFTVVSSRARIHVSQPTATTTGNQFALLCLTGASADISVSTALSDYCEIIDPSIRDWGLLGTLNNGRSAMFESKWIKFDAKKFFGKQLNVLYADFQGSASSSPVEQAFFNVVVGAWDGSSDTDAVRALVEIEFFARFSEPKPLPAS